MFRLLFFCFTAKASDTTVDMLVALSGLTLDSSTMPVRSVRRIKVSKSALLVQHLWQESQTYSVNEIFQRLETNFPPLLMPVKDALQKRIRHIYTETHAVDHGTFQMYLSKMDFDIYERRCREDGNSLNPMTPLLETIMAKPSDTVPNHLNILRYKTGHSCGCPSLDEVNGTVWSLFRYIYAPKWFHQMIIGSLVVPDDEVVHMVIARDSADPLYRNPEHVAACVSIWQRFAIFTDDFEETIDESGFIIDGEFAWKLKPHVIKEYFRFVLEHN